MFDRNDYVYRYACAWATGGYRLIPICTGVKCPPSRERMGLTPNDSRTVFDLGANDPTTIAGWFQGQFTGYNLGLCLPQSGVVDVSSDCPEWEAKFQKRGLPETLTFASGSGYGWHHLYRAPADLPTGKLNAKGQFDILYSSGICVLPPSAHKSGNCYELLSPLYRVSALPECPAWACDLIRERAAARAARTTDRGVIPLVEMSEPPVPLKGAALEFWHGRRFIKRGDSIDRSVTQWAIAKDLFKAGADRDTVLQAIKNRDRALGHLKGEDVVDEDSYYWETVLNAAAEAERERSALEACCRVTFA